MLTSISALNLFLLSFEILGLCSIFIGFNNFYIVNQICTSDIRTEEYDNLQNTLKLRANKVYVKEKIIQETVFKKVG
jgi:hypothetical protein